MARSKAEKARLTVGAHTWRDDLKLWATPMDYATWKEAVCGVYFAPETVLQEFYEAQWDAADCREYMMLNKMLGSASKGPAARVVTLDDAAINRRYALALWRESTKLMTRRMTPSARQLVSDMYVRMTEQLGLKTGDPQE